MFLPHFDVLCDLLLNRRTATWNLFVLYNKELKKVLMMTSSLKLFLNSLLYKTNRFQVAVRLFSDRLQMMHGNLESIC